MKKIILIIISIVIGILIYRSKDIVIIPNDSIRVRIISNSNEIKDLITKKNIKEKLENDIFSLMKNIHSIDEARNFIDENYSLIDETIKNNIDTTYTISYGLNYFPRKMYKGVLYQEGNYESLIINLGSGLGENWWCVLYPPLCLIDDNNTTSNVEYKSFVKELLS